MYEFQGKLRRSLVIEGVVGTAKYRSLREPPTPIAYTLHSNAYPARILYVRTFNDPAFLLGQVVKLVHEQDARVPILSVSTLEQELQSSMWQERLLTLLCALFALIAVGLTLAGVYGVLAYSVAAQRRAIGIRLALGAKSSHITGSVCRGPGLAVALGSAVGLIAAFMLARLAQRVTIDSFLLPLREEAG